MSMKAAIIGGGFAGKVHAAALRAVGVTPEVIITTREESARAFAEENGIPKWSSVEREGYEAAFAGDIDAVHVCTPPTSHAEIVRTLLAHRKNILCEKPLALSFKEADALAKEADASGLLCALTFNVRYHLAVEKARALIREGAIGTPLLIHGSYLQEFHALPANPDWRYDAKLGGNMRAVTEIGTHWIDTVQYVSGKKVTEVSAQFANFWPERTASEDAAAVLLRFEDGAMGSVMLSEVSPGRGNHLSFEITGDKGNLWWNEEENNFLHTAKKGAGIHTEVFSFGNGFGDTFETLLRKYYNAMEGVPTFAEGAQVAAVCDAIYESAQTGSRFVPVKA